jgi:diacylglycerol kinase family enzyme
LAPQPGELEQTLAQIIQRKPDLVVVLAGDGTARLAAEAAGPHGPLIAPLPGGTMNMLPKALYGEVEWKTALREALSGSIERPIGGGEIGGHTFYVAAMLGSTALFGPAREAARNHRLGEAARRAANAYRRAFAGRLRVELDDTVAHKTQALTLMCPMISKTLSDEEQWMEAAAIDPHNAAEAMRIGARVALSRLVGDWRQDPAVTIGLCRSGRVWANFPLPALIDGEPVKLGRDTTFSYRPKAFRALAPAPREEEQI